MVAPPAGEHDQPVRLAAGELGGAGELERRLDRLRAAGDRVDRRVGHRQVRPDLRRVALERLGGERRAVGVGEAGRPGRRSPPAISRRPWPTLTTIAPPAASRYSRPSASTIVEPWASTATGGWAAAARRKTRPLTRRSRARRGPDGSRADCRFGGVRPADPGRPGRPVGASAGGGSSSGTDASWPRNATNQAVPGNGSRIARSAIVSGTASSAPAGPISTVQTRIETIVTTGLTSSVVANTRGWST